MLIYQVGFLVFTLAYEQQNSYIFVINSFNIHDTYYLKEDLQNL